MTLLKEGGGGGEGISEKRQNDVLMDKDDYESLNCLKSL